MVSHAHGLGVLGTALPVHTFFEQPQVFRAWKNAGMFLLLAQGVILHAP